ncbi:MAG: hypothetical protein CMM26_12690 [Rhodospirillaceae bacterium]|nr:hypothetical protein [Rhodospirillaceae bacterium]
MNKPSAETAGASKELRIIVWQFVRIMVQLEIVARARGNKKAPSVYGDWHGAWTEIDRTLARLGDSDAVAFSDLMMNQEVVLRVRDRSQMNEVMRAIENVINQLDQEIRAVRGEAKAEEELRFERRELNALLKKLRKMSRGGGAERQSKGRTGGGRSGGGRSGGPKAASPPRRGRARKG